MAFLAGARDETTQLANVYDHVAIFVGPDITPQQFLKRGADASIISFAGHTTAGALVFESRGQSPPTLLSASEITRSRFSRHPLVVLAACSSGRGRILSTEGVESLANAFLGAGARSVVATLWDVADESSSRLFATFHRNIGRGDSAANALRAAQLAMIHSNTTPDQQPVAWAGVFIVGSK
jgi:CHAT domain-containing protein